MNILTELRLRLDRALSAFVPDANERSVLASMVKPAQQDRFGDFQANCAMPLAKSLGADPRELASRIAAALDVADMCRPPDVAGPGFINLTLRNDWLEDQVRRMSEDKRLGIAPATTPRVYIVDYSAPNVAKPMHVGHLRSTVIGDTLCRVLRFLGHRALGDNHIGDWGTQFGMIIYGYKHFLDSAAYERDAVGELARLYRLVNQLCDYFETLESLPGRGEELAHRQEALRAAESAGPAANADASKSIKKLRSDVAELNAGIDADEKKCGAIENDPHLAALVAAHPQILVETRRETAQLHAGDGENRRLWEQFLPKCLAALQGVYNRLGIRFDLSLGESYYQPMLAEVVELLASRGIARESEGALCIFLDEHEAPLIVRKGDGAFTYATTDLATIRYRVDTLHADVVLYVVDARQSEHFRALFATARRWGYDRAEFRHVSFGTVLGDDKRPFKTRSGDTVGLESLLDEAVARARLIVDENDNAKEKPELDEAARTAVAEVVGIGGIKYADLHHNRDSDYVFSWEKMLAKTGDTATYVQYSFARICGIFRKGGLEPSSFRRSCSLRITHPSERRLALRLIRYCDSVESIVDDYRPHLLTMDLFETADCFTTFYENCNVLKEEDAAVRTSRLLLCDLTARVLRHGLELLGIGTSEQM